MQEYGLNLVNNLSNNHYDAVILTVSHKEFIDMGINGIKASCKEQHVIFDVKHILPVEEIDGRL